MRNILKENVFYLLKTLSKQDPNLGLKLRLKIILFQQPQLEQISSGNQ